MKTTEERTKNIAANCIRYIIESTGCDASEVLTDILGITEVELSDLLNDKPDNAKDEPIKTQPPDNMIEEGKKVKIPLADGYSLCSVYNDASGRGASPEIVTYIEDCDGLIHQDIALVRPSEMCDGGVEIFVWGDPYDEDYTKQLDIGLFRDESNG